MRRARVSAGWAAAMLAAAVAPAQAAKGPPVPLQPAGKWTVDYATDMCVLQRTFGEGKAAISIGFRPIPLSSQAEFAVLRSSGDYEPYRRGRGSVTLDGHVFPATLESFALDKGTRRLITFYSDVGIDDVLKADVVTVQGDGAGPVAVAPHGSAGVRAVVDRCQDDLLKTWGVDVAALEATTERARPVRPLGQLFSAGDYPTSSVVAREGGRVLALMTVGADGGVTGCHPVLSATKALDEVTCAILAGRARFTPARDAEGKAIASWASLSVRWQLP